jgi:serine phosphatase RsbU (regulator of sigma subunit)
VYLTTRRTAHGVEVRLARGGHPAPLLRRADGTVEAVEAPGGLLGCLPEPGVKDFRLLLAPGDLLLLYTDGVTEARRGDEQFTDARLERLLAGSEPDPHALIEAVIAAVLTHCDGDLADDMAVLAVLAT